MSERSVRRAHQRRLAAAQRREALLRRRLGLAAGAVVGASAMVAVPASAGAATLTVTNNDDAGPGSLRDAITQANAAAGPDTVVFDGVTGTITVASQLIIEDELTIDGPGAGALTISGGDATRVFFVESPATLEGLTIADGVGDNGGGVFSSGRLSLVDSVVSGNAATSDGGGVFAYNALDLVRTTVTGNTAQGVGGGVGIDINTFTKYDADIVDSTISGNTAQGGGGLFTQTKYTNVTRSTISGNTIGEGGRGAGVLVDQLLPNSRTTISQSTVSGNTGGAGTSGGGIGFSRSGFDRGGPASSGINGTFELVNSTVSGNTAETGSGIGFGSPTSEFYSSSEASISLANSTIAANTGEGVHLNPGGDPENTEYTSAPVLLTSTIVSGNPGGDLVLGDAGLPGSGFDLSFSLVQNPGTATFAESPAGSNKIGVDPQLGPLQDNGGPTLTHAPAATSPVVDQGDAPASLTVDQRGLPRTDDTGAPRPSGGDGTDIGAVELDLPTRPLQQAPGAPAPGTTVPGDAKPTVSFTAPAANAGLRASATTVLTATASDDKGVAAVQFVDGGRVLCTDTTAPYTCNFRPTSADVGRKDFEAVAIDTVGQIGTATRTVTVGRFSATGLTIKVTPGSDETSPYTFTTSGRLQLPSRVTRAAGCSGRVTVQIKSGRQTISTRRVKVSANCTYSSRVAFRVKRRLGKGKLVVRATYSGSEVLAPRRSKRVSVTAVV